MLWRYYWLKHRIMYVPWLIVARWHGAPPSPYAWAAFMTGTKPRQFAERFPREAP